MLGLVAAAALAKVGGIVAVDPAEADKRHDIAPPERPPEPSQPNNRAERRRQKRAAEKGYFPRPSDPIAVANRKHDRARKRGTKFKGW